jgi:predicted N-acetyltransferase YhbS
MDIELRKATGKDAKMLLEHLHSVGKETNNLSFGAEDFNISEEKEARFIERFSKNEKDLMLVALDGDQIVGYIHGSYYTKEKKTSYMDAGKRGFEVEGLYVLPAYRSEGIGGTLYRLMEKFVTPHCSYITLATSTKDYPRILKFYVDDLKMTFHSAFLFKSLEEPLCE